jgi:hypothetical protein
MAGQSQSPFGIFATTSMRPYVIVFLPDVVRRADLTGFIMMPDELLLVVTQAEASVEVQFPSLVKFKV